MVESFWAQGLNNKPKNAHQAQIMPIIRQMALRDQFQLDQKKKIIRTSGWEMKEAFFGKAGQKKTCEVMTPRGRILSSQSPVPLLFTTKERSCLNEICRKEKSR